MSGERNNDPNSSAENLIISASNDGSLSEQNGYSNQAGPDSMPSSPPPSYHHVLEETRMTGLGENKTPNNMRRNRIIKQTSVDSMSLSSTHSSPNSRSKLTRRSNTMSSEESINATIAKRADKENLDHEVLSKNKNNDLVSNAAASESSLWQDYHEPSTSYDVSSRQFDESSVATLPIDRFDKDSEEEGDVTMNEREIEEEEIRQEDERIYEVETRHDNEIREEYECNLRHQTNPEEYIEVPNKTSKVMYLAMAKEMGLACSMSDQCRCLDCQGGYLETGDGDTGDENVKTDGGLGAGTPMFVSEAFGHGMAPACAIL